MITYFNPCLHCSNNSNNNNNKHITCNAAELNINISKNNIAFFPMQEEFENFKLFIDLKQPITLIPRIIRKQVNAKYFKTKHLVK